MDPNAVIKDGKLIVTIDLLESPRPSASGKSITLATTAGNKDTDLKHEGKRVKVSVNAYIPAK